MGTAFLYGEINIFCILIMLLLIYKTSGALQMASQQVFRRAMWAQVIFFAADCVAYLMIQGAIPGEDLSIELAKTAYFLATTTMCFDWMMYFEHIRSSKIARNRKIYLLLAIPIFLQVILSLFNLKNGFFYQSVGKNYQRGSLFIIQYFIAYTYVLLAIIRAFLAGVHRDNYVDRDNLMTMWLFPVLPGIAGIIQFIRPELPLACAALTLATLLLYFNFLMNAISLDPLTKIYNRKQLMWAVSKAMKVAEAEGEEGKLAFLLIDANLFKSINDTYGHIEGDEALKRIADALSLATKHMKHTTVARYGGDEFVVLGKFQSQEEIKKLCVKIHETLKDLNEKAKAPYNLTVTIGVARYYSQIRTVREFIARADKKLYEEKRKLKGR